jgi:DNA-binding PadR family transcriptional regulator
MPLKRLRELNTTDNLWVYVLRILSDEPMHAYALREAVRKRFGFRPGTVTAYKVLYLLKRDGLVDKRTEGRQKIYTVTDKGRESLKKAVDFYEERASLLK